MELGDSLKRFRTARNLTFAAAAAAFGKTRNVWYSYEKGNAIPPITAVISVAKEFGVSIDYLVGLTDDPTPRWSIDGAEKETESQGDNAAAEKAEMTASEVTAHILKMEKALAAIQARLDGLEGGKN